MSALSDLLNWHIEDKFPDKSNRQIAISAGVSRGTIDNYRSGSHPDAPGEEVLQAFHDLLGIPLAELRAAAGVPRGERAARNQLGMSQQKLADKLAEHGIAMDTSAVTRLEGGNRVIRLGEAIVISQVLNFSMDLNQDGRTGESVVADELERLAYQMIETVKALRSPIQDW